MFSIHFSRFLLLLLWLCIPNGCLASKNKDYAKIPFMAVTKGLFLNPLPTVFVYQGSIPISFILDLPSLTSAPPLGTLQCDNQNLARLCSLAEKTKQMSDELLTSILDTHPYMNVSTRNTTNETESKSRQMRGLMDFSGEIQKFLFGVATVSDVQKLHVSEGFIANRQKEIENALTEEHKALVDVVGQINAYSSTLKQIVHEEIGDIVRNIHSIADEYFNLDAAMSHVMVNIIYNQYMSFTAHSLDEAFSDCRNQLIPRSLLPMKEIKSRLKSLELKMKEHGYEAAAELNALYKLNIADCWFGNSKLQVTVHVPIKRIEEKFELFEVVRIPYQWGNEQCSLLDGTPYVAVHGDTVIPVSKHLERYCQPKTKGMCYIPPSEKNPSIFGNCAEAILKSSSEVISRECIFHCHPANTTRVSEVAQGKVAITNAKTIEMVCNNTKNNKIYNVTLDVGSILLKVPCTCRAIINRNLGEMDIIVHPPYPCTVVNDVNQETITHIIPAHMSKIRGLILDESPLRYTNLSEMIDFNWNKNIPVLNITQPKTLHFNPNTQLSQLKFAFQEGSNVVYIWLTVLTFVICGISLVFFAPSLCSMPHKISPFFSVMLIIPGVCGDTENSSKTVVSSVLSLIKAMEITELVVGVVGVIMGIILIYFFIKLYKNVSALFRISLASDVEMPQYRSSFRR